MGVCLFLGSLLLVVTCKPRVAGTVGSDSNYLLAFVYGVAVSQTVLITDTQKLCSAAETEVTVNVKKNPPTVYM